MLEYDGTGENFENREIKDNSQVFENKKDIGETLEDNTGKQMEDSRYYYSYSIGDLYKFSFLDKCRQI